MLFQSDTISRSYQKPICSPRLQEETLKRDGVLTGLLKLNLDELKFNIDETFNKVEEGCTFFILQYLQDPLFRIDCCQLITLD